MRQGKDPRYNYHRLWPAGSFSSLGRLFLFGWRVNRRKVGLSGSLDRHFPIWHLVHMEEASCDLGYRFGDGKEAVLVSAGWYDSIQGYAEFRLRRIWGDWRGFRFNARVFAVVGGKCGGRTSGIRSASRVHRDLTCRCPPG